MIYQQTLYFNKNVYFEGIMEQKRNKDRTFQGESTVFYHLFVSALMRALLPWEPQP